MINRIARNSSIDESNSPIEVEGSSRRLANLFTSATNLSRRVWSIEILDSESFVFVMIVDDEFYRGEWSGTEHFP